MDENQPTLEEYNCG